MYNISIQQLKTLQGCNTLQVCEKERTHAEGAGLPNEINSHKKIQHQLFTQYFLFVDYVPTCFGLYSWSSSRRLIEHMQLMFLIIC
jgi:hypothetical protein